jgi:16S rRNA (uracil1498-N3)-methyltransferase
VSHWFIASPRCWSQGRVILPSEESHHAHAVLRAGPGEEITVGDGFGRVARCAISAASNSRLEAEVLSEERHSPLRPAMGVYQGAAKGSKTDEVVERLAELGVAEATVFSSRRSVVRWDENKLSRLEARWAARARAAAKQSRNPFVMQTGAEPFDEVVARVEGEPLALLLWEGATQPLRRALEPSPERLALVVGPEGGFDRIEAEALERAGARTVSLGPRILRTENAALVAAGALFWHYGLMG